MPIYRKDDQMMIHCEAELCVYNRDYLCALGYIEVDSFGKCLQNTPLPIPDETLSIIPKEAMDLIKAEYLKNEGKPLGNERING